MSLVDPRLERLLELVSREDERLLAVRSRLLGKTGTVSSEWIEETLATDIGIDRLESFGAKFGRMQDTVIDKLVPAVLAAAGEPVAAAIDNLGRLERLGLVDTVDEWLQMRRLRNRLVHEYIDRPDDLAGALERAGRFTDRMHSDFKKIEDYARSHLQQT